MSRVTLQRAISLSLQVLEAAARRSRCDNIQTPEVRLALTVLWFVMTDRTALKAYWERAGTKERKAWETCLPLYEDIVRTLQRDGWKI